MDGVEIIAERKTIKKKTGKSNLSIKSNLIKTPNKKKSITPPTIVKNQCNIGKFGLYISFRLYRFH